MRALRGAYGDDRRLSELPLNILFAARSGDETLIWARKGSTWAPVSESGGRGHTAHESGLGSEAGYEAFKQLRTAAGRLTVKDLKPYRDARAWW